MSTKDTHPEYQYLNQLRQILETGARKDDRTGTGTISLFGTQSRYSLRDNVLPVLTTKRVFWKAVVHELLWFVRGSTDAKELAAKNVRIWDANASREFLDKSGLTHHREGDLGPIYGFQWRHYGAEYVNADSDYAGQGIDQLSEVVRLIKTDPDSRRIVMTAWNPADLGKMALPPCHVIAQFYVGNNGLSCQLYQRSGDMGLGVPFNIASYSLLTRMIAKVTGLMPGEFVHVLGDAHIYSTHVEAIRKQLERTPRPFPKLFIARNVTDIDDFDADDFDLVGYDPHPTIKMEMAV